MPSTAKALTGESLAYFRKSLVFADAAAVVEIWVMTKTAVEAGTFSHSAKVRLTVTTSRTTSSAFTAQAIKVTTI